MRVVEKALRSFWTEVEKAYPHVTTRWVEPVDEHHLQVAADDAIIGRVRMNDPTMKGGLLADSLDALRRKAADLEFENHPFELADGTRVLIESIDGWKATACGRGLFRKFAYRSDRFAVNQHKETAVFAVTFASQTSAEVQAALATF